MNKSLTIEAAITIALLGAGTVANADITVAQGASGTTYGTTLNFDEIGGPTGSTSTDAWAGIGLAEMQSGDGAPSVGDVSGFYPWINSGNSFFGNFGVFMTFDSDLTNFSGQFWDPSGDPGPFGGGMGIFVFNDGVEVANNFVTPAWGGLGDTWIDVSATDGMVFDEIRVLGFGFGPTTYADNLSWNAVPTPGALGLLTIAGVASTRRRR